MTRTATRHDDQTHHIPVSCFFIETQKSKSLKPLLDSLSHAWPQYTLDDIHDVPKNQPGVLIMHTNDFVRWHKDIIENKSHIILCLSTDEKDGIEKTGALSRPSVSIVYPPLSEEKVVHMIHQAHHRIRLQYKLIQMEKMTNRNLLTFNALGNMFSSKKIQTPHERVKTILGKMRSLTQSDAGTLYMVEPRGIPYDERKKAQKDGEASDYSLSFKISQNDSVAVTSLSHAKIPINPKSLAGFAAISGSPLIIDDAYHIPPDSPYQFNPRFDKQTGYRTRSILVVPLTNPDKVVIGVVELINHKIDGSDILRNELDYLSLVAPYGDDLIAITHSFANYVAMVLEHDRLLEDTQHLFQSFAHASVVAIEQRDESTSGHSERVAALSLALAEKVNEQNEGPLRTWHFDDNRLVQINFASLLHDFGKIGTNEHILTKEYKLFPWEIEILKEREMLIKEIIYRQFYEKISKITTANNKQSLKEKAKNEKDQALTALRNDFKIIYHAIKNPTKDTDIIKNISKKKFKHKNGENISILLPHEVESLSIKYGTLTQKERKEIQSHVTHTYEFLTQIPWTSELAHIPEIAYCHHEKLNGSGYPRGIRGDAIPLESQIITVTDIFDALTANDRPYRMAMSLSQALATLDEEASRNCINKDLVALFREAKIHKAVGLGDDKT